MTYNGFGFSLLHRKLVNMLDSQVIRIRWVVAGIFLAMGVAVYAAAQGMTEFPNRREGQNVHLNARNDFTLIAIHRNFQLFPRKANLNVRFFLPQSGGESGNKVFVEAALLQDSALNYFMEAKSSYPWKAGSCNTFGPWPTKDVIDPKEIRAENLGVRAGYRTSNGRPVYLPADVYQNDVPLTKAQLTKYTYTFHLNTGETLQSLDLSLTSAAGVRMSVVSKSKLKCEKSRNPNCTWSPAGGVLAFEVDMSGMPQGEYHLMVVGHVRGKVPVTSLEIVLYHYPWRGDEC